MSEPICPLCRSAIISGVIQKVHKREYHHCEVCDLIFMDKSDLPDMVSEKERYLLHINSGNNDGYVRFLKQAIDPAENFMNKSMKILDYGCGPKPVLSEILVSRGFDCDLYDPFFFPEWPNKKYELIFATECFEHFFDPKKEIKKLMKLIHENGYLVLMTDFWKDVNQFSSWYYVRDFTHVSFYHEKTMKFMELIFGLSIVYTDNQRCIIFRKT
jgi:hypothetical protein